MCLTPPSTTQQLTLLDPASCLNPHQPDDAAVNRVGKLKPGACGRGMRHDRARDVRTSPRGHACRCNRHLTAKMLQPSQAVLCCAVGSPECGFSPMTCGASLSTPASFRRGVPSLTASALPPALPVPEQAANGRLQHGRARRWMLRLSACKALCMLTVGLS